MFKTVYVLSDIWQHTGWNSIIYLAALSAVDISLYEAANMDGANKLQKMIYIDIPCLVPTAIILLVLSTGNILNVGFDKVFLNARQFTVNEFVQYIRKYADYLLKLISSVKENSTSIIENIIIYINMNYLKYDFSIQNISDDFGMLTSNFSAFFKRHTGLNFIDYVDSLRIQKAKEMLKEQTINIGDIAYQLGYASSSSFGRNFRRVVGITPGEFRKRIVEVENND